MTRVGTLASVKQSYTDGTRRLASRWIAGLARTRVSPNALTAAGVTLCAISAVLVWFAGTGDNKWLLYWIAAIVFVVGSVLDILDGALARRSDKATPFGAFLDSISDRVSEGFVLTAIALVLARRREPDRGRLHDRGDRRFVPRLLRAREGRAARAARRRRPRQPSRACRPDHRRSRARAVDRAAVGDLRPRRDRLVHRLPADLERSNAASRPRPVSVGAIVLALLCYHHHRKNVLVRMPAALKRRLADEVQRSGQSLNDVAVGILASRFAVPFEPSGRPGKVPGGSGSVLLRMPVELKDTLAARAAQRKRKLNEVIVETLDAGLGKEPMATSNGKVRRSEDKVRVAIVGVGNCASSLVQGVEYYKDADPDEFVPGLMHVDLGGYHVRDIEFTAAFDITVDKVGKDLADAIWAAPNNTIKFADVPKTGITVSRGMAHDGIGKYLSEVVTKAPGETDDVAGILKETGTDVVINYLPVGSEEATKWYTEQVLNAGCAMVNCMPVFIGRESYWQRRFEEQGVPIIGDDIKSQVGATITHRVLTSIFRDRGVRVDRTFQLNFGGNSDFMNMLERDRLESKKISKTNSIKSTLPYELEEKNIHVGPSDYVPWLEDRKWAYIRIEGTAFGDVPLNAELKLEVWDSPNSAGVVIDAVRLAKLALNNGVSGTLGGPSAYLMKSPPKQYARRGGARPDGGLHPQERAEARQADREGLRPDR